MQKLGVAHCDAASAAPMEGAPQTGVTYRVSSANVGFGAYSADYSFFMDGGKESRARSRQAVDENMRGEVSLVKDLSPDFALFQEVDIYGTRSWHIGEDAYLRRCDGEQRIQQGIRAELRQSRTSSILLLTPTARTSPVS